MTTEAFKSPVNELTYRQFNYTFAGLSYKLRLKLAVEFDLTDDTDIHITDVERTSRYIKRAIEKDLMIAIYNVIIERGWKN